MLAVPPPAAPPPAPPLARPASAEPRGGGGGAGGGPDSDPGTGPTSATFSDAPRPGDKENPFRDQSLGAQAQDGSRQAVASSVSSRLAKSQSVIENLQRSLVTKLSPATIQSLQSKYAATPAPLAKPEPLDPDLDANLEATSPLLPVKSRPEVADNKPRARVNGNPPKQAPAAVFDVTDVENQSSVKLAFLSGEAVKQPAPKPVKKAVERKPLHIPWARKIVAKHVDKQAAKPPVPVKKEALRDSNRQTVAVKKSPSKPARSAPQQDGLSELLKTLVTDSSSSSERSTEKSRGGDAAARSGTSESPTGTTASPVRPSRPQPAPRTSSLPPPAAARTSREPSLTQPSPPRPLSLSPLPRPSPATSPGRTPPERSQLLEHRLNEIRKDLWEEQEAPRRRSNEPPAAADAADALSTPPRSVQEATLEHYARAIQKHLDGRGAAPVAPRLSELRIDTSSSTHSSTSTLVSTPSQSPGWDSLPPTPRGRRSADGGGGEDKKRLREELLGFYYRSLEREGRGGSSSRSGRLSAPPLPYVIPTDQATYTADRTLRQEFIVVPDATYQNVRSLRRPPGSPLPAPGPGEDSDSTLASQELSPRPRSNMNFFVRGGPQRSTVGAYPARRTPPRDEVDLRREFGADVELRHPEKLAMAAAAGHRKRHTSESEATPTAVNGKSGKGGGKPYEAWGSGKEGKKSTKANGSSSGGKKSLFPIFRKGSLHPSPPTTPGTPPPTLPKRVSFSSATSPMYATSTPNGHGAGLPNGDGWPTRNGPAASPPTRTSRLDSNDSVFLPNNYCAHEQIYANQYAVSPGEGTYVNYTMPTPPELQPGVLNGGTHAVNGYSPASMRSPVYGNSPRTPTGGVYGTGRQSQPPPSALYGHARQQPSPAGPPSAGVYGSAQQQQQQPSPGVYGVASKSSAGMYGSTQQSASSPGQYGVVYGTRQQASPGPARAATPQQDKTPNGVAYSPSQPPVGSGSSPGSASVGSAPSPAGSSFNASASTSLNTSGTSPYGQQHGQGRLYGRAGLPPRAQSATPTMMMAPDRPLPPIPAGRGPAGPAGPANKLSQLTLSESESGSEAGEVQRILQQANDKKKITYVNYSAEEEWGVGGKGRGPGDLGGPPGGGGGDEMRRGGGRGGRGGRDDPRRHTLGGDQHSLPPQGGSLSRSMDLEMSAKQRKKSPMARGYPPPSNAMLFDDDPGIMSEVETASTGFHRGGKQRSSLPVVRTPSKTLERPLGLVFLQYRNETKRALLPNEITSIDTVKALFVRSFCKQLTMEYLDSPHVKIYIHDSNKDMFYELEDHRSHLRDIRDRSVLRLFESTDLHGGMFPGAGTGLVPPTMWETDQSYFSEPEFDSEYQHQHIHKSKASKASSVPPQPYYMTHSFPPGAPPGVAPGPGVPGSSATLPRGGSLMRAYSPAPKSLPPSDRLHAESGYMSSPERGGPRAYPTPAYPASASVPYEEGYYGQYGTRSGSITPVIDEEASDTELMDEQYGLYGVKLPGAGGPGPRGPPAPSAARAPFPTPAGPPYDVTRIRVENMERQLANLTGLVQKALTHGPTHLAVPGSQGYRNDKSVSFEKSVSFSDEPPDMNSPKQHSPQHGADTKPTKPAIKSSTLPRTSSQERDRHKPAPPPKPMSLSPGQYEGRNIYRDLQLTPEMYNQLRGLQKKAKDLRQEVRNLRRMSQAQAHSVRETIRDTFIKIRAMLITGAEGSWAAIGDAEKLRLSREEELYKQEMLRLEKDLTELESTVEELRGNVINRKTRVNMSDVENMALILSKSSKTVADLKVRFPGLQDEMKSLLSAEMDKVVREEKFLKEEPERLESALRRCKKLTGTLVTLKRLASVQEQRLPCPPGTVSADARLSPTLDDEPLPPTPNSASSKACVYGSTRSVMGSNDSGGECKRPENALDALLDELQTFAKPPATNQTHPPTMAEIGRRKGSIETANPPPSNPTSSLRRLHSYPSSSDGGGNSPPNIARLQVSDSKPPVPERNADLLAKRVPPPPPPRTSSRSPLASPTSPSLPPRSQNPPSQPQMGTQGTLRRAQAGRGSVRSCSIPGTDPLRNPLVVEDQQAPSTANAAASNSSSCESVNSQEGAAAKKERQEALEQRHQELLRKQRALQEQYARLQQLQRGTATVPTPDLLLKKTGSESNLLAKMGMQGLSAAAPMSGSLTHLATAAASTPLTAAQTTTSKIYETDIL